MSFFKSIGNSIKSAVKKVEDKVIEPIAKDAIPLAAAYFSGGASTQFLPPKNVGERLGKITGLPVNAMLGVGQKNGEIVENASTPPLQQASIYDQLSSYWPLVGNNQMVNTSPNARSFDSQPISQAKNNLPLIIGGALALVGILIFALKRK